MQHPAEPQDAAVLNQTVIETQQREAGEGGGEGEHQLGHECNLVGSGDHGDGDVPFVAVPAIVFVGEYHNRRHADGEDLIAIMLEHETSKGYRCNVSNVKSSMEEKKGAGGGRFGSLRRTYASIHIESSKPNHLFTTILE